ncbi:uncharacterized protein LOC108864959 [Galendromus occidentalis]|uniref:Uncharacterized protein LOC108864959 n=1 Tax=Galendromus occidentalis TaxID=34638 RepID=A0AAJ7PAV7_9ACAR|nr:uncharacterized protein LOC108864959 [Galendromus occidentalis]
MYNCFVNHCSSIIEECIPSTNTASSDISAVRSYIDRLKLKLQSAFDPSLALKLEKASNRIRVLTESKLNPRNSRGFFRYANSRIRAHEAIPTLRSSSKVSVEARDKADLLGQHFASIFDPTPLPPQTSTPAPNPTYPSTRLRFSEYDVYNLLSHLDGKSQTTPENIPSIFFKKFAIFLAEPLTIIFERSYNDGEVPEFFRRSIVTPIYKKGNKSDPTNYRPIAQGSIACKVMEKLIAQHLIDFLTRNDLLDQYSNSVC